ncbi:M10 family metallopeptidase C-terminal domain-containing protein [Inquilinus limosus]|uniref:calcium-binding protein n=1 Tax=Inquilinus limosus TaxID=171674 RepID=UPI003F181E73
MANYQGTVGDDHIIVPANDDFDSVYALTGSDLIEVDPGHTGRCSISLRDGGDTVYGGSGVDYLSWYEDSPIEDTQFYGGAGNDIVFLNDTAEIGDAIVLDGGAGRDSFWVHGRGAFVHLGNGTALIGRDGEPGVFHELSLLNFDWVDGTGEHDILVGSDRGNAFRGFLGDDLLSGRGGTDHLEGGWGDDILVGGRGADGLQSDRGADILRIDRLVESLPGQEDTILDFSTDDTIDVSRIDADLTTAGNQAFTFTGTAAFSGAAGELRYEVQGSDLLVSADADGDRVPDLGVKVLDLTALTAEDFIL